MALSFLSYLLDHYRHCSCHHPCNPDAEMEKARMIRIYWQKEIKKGAEHSAGAALLERMVAAAKNIEKGPFGKPYLKDGPFFNLSHSAGYLALAIGERELGVDIEAPRKIKHQGFVQVGEENIEPLTLWVVKESFMKWTGEGVRQFRSVRAEQIGEQLYRVTDGAREAIAQTFRMESCIGAVTMKEPEEIKIEQIN